MDSYYIGFKMGNFYKKIDNNLMVGRYIINKNYELYIDLLDTYELPINGWYYFNTIEEANKFFGIVNKQSEIETLKNIFSKYENVISESIEVGEILNNLETDNVES